MSKPDTDIVVVRTRSLRGGHYRAGVRHEAEAIDWPAGTFDAGRLARLQADQDLEVTLLPSTDAAPEATTDDDKTKGTKKGKGK